MPQEIIIMRCYKCSIYQGQISKKSRKWTCVRCGEKQSLKETYGRGSGKECRVIVQKLNEMRCMAEEKLDNELEERGNCGEEKHGDDEPKNASESFFEENKDREVTGFCVGRKKSKWLKYLDDPEPDDSDDP